MSPFWTLLELRMMGAGGGDNCSCKTCKAPVKSSPPTPTGPMPFLSPNQQCQSTERKIKQRYTSSNISVTPDWQCVCCKRHHSRSADSSADHKSNARNFSASSRDGGDEYSSEASEFDSTKNVSMLRERDDGTVELGQHLQPLLFLYRHFTP